jgi:hypothetical protein
MCIGSILREGISPSCWGVSPRNFPKLSKRVLDSEFSKARSRKRVRESEVSKARGLAEFVGGFPREIFRNCRSEFSTAISRKRGLESEFVKARFRKRVLESELSMQVPTGKLVFTLYVILKTNLGLT